MSQKKNFESPKSIIDSKNPMLRKLGEAMQKHNEEWPAEKFVSPQIIMDILKIPRAELFTKRGGYPDSPDQKRPLYLDRCALYFFILKANPEETFLMNEKEEEDWLLANEAKKDRKGKNWVDPKKLLTWETWRKIKAKWGERKVYLDFEDKIFSPDEDRNEKLKETYEEIAKKYYSNAKSTIVAHELLFKGNNKNPNKYRAYSEAQICILKEIEFQLKQKADLKYERNFYLSLDDDFNFKKDQLTWGRAFVTEASIATLIHVSKCLRDYPGRCHFRIYTSTSFRHKVIIDNKYMLIEDYAEYKSMIVPESICVLDVRNQNETVRLLKLTEKIQERRDFEPITIGDISLNLEDVSEHLDKEIKIREALIEELNPKKRTDEKYKLLLEEILNQTRVYRKMSRSVGEKLEVIKNLT